MSAVALLTDFGRRDHYVGVLHAVLAAVAPGVERLDLGHEVDRGDVWHGAFLLRAAWPWLAPGTVVLAVVDPGVGTARRAVAAARDGRWLVAPDNGLAAAVGRPERAVVLDWRRMGLAAPSRTFHGRDLFAPAAARLARGDDPATLGADTDSATLVPCPLPEPGHDAAGLPCGAVVHVDRFGNLVTNLGSELGRPGAMLRSAAGTARWVETYAGGAKGEVVAIAGSSGLLELAVNGGSAAAVTGLERGAVLTVG